MFRNCHVRRLMSIVFGCAAVGAIVAIPLGCADKTPPPKVQARYATLKPKNVPPFLKSTVFERTLLMNTEPYLINGFGVVANLDGTGDSSASNAVREYIVKEMVKHKVGSSLIPGMNRITPEQVLRDPRFAIVQVDGFLPPGVRKGQRFDIQVSAIPESNTTSLAR